MNALYDPLTQLEPKEETKLIHKDWRLVSSIELNDRIAEVMRHIDVIKAHLGANWQDWYDAYDGGELDKAEDVAEDEDAGFTVRWTDWDVAEDETDDQSLFHPTCSEDTYEPSGLVKCELDPQERVVRIIDDHLTEIPLTSGEKDYLVEAVRYDRFRQISINLEVGGYFGITKSTPENDSGWTFFGSCPTQLTTPSTPRSATRSDPMALSSLRALLPRRDCCFPE